MYVLQECCSLLTKDVKLSHSCNSPSTRKAESRAKGGRGEGPGVKPKILYALKRYDRYLQQWHGGIFTRIYSVAHSVSSGSRHHGFLCVAVKHSLLSVQGQVIRSKVGGGGQAKGGGGNCRK